jgi:hypothetical protein
MHLFRNANVLTTDSAPPARPGFHDIILLDAHAQSKRNSKAHKHNRGKVSSLTFRPKSCSASSAIMPKCCINCSAVASQDILLKHCAACQSALYCSKACQRQDWEEQHRQICKLLNVGDGAMQVRTDMHTDRYIELKELLEINERNLDEDGKLFFKLYQESTFEGSRAAALEMKKIAKRQTKDNQLFLLFHSLYLLIRSDSEMLSWPNSPLLVMLEFIDPNVLFGGENAPLQEGENRATPLHVLVGLADPFDYSTHEKQLILARQLIEHGANVNAVSIPDGITPLHNACYSGTVTNLNFIKFLLKEGADPNAQDHQGLTPLFWAVPFAPGAVKCLMSSPTTEVNIIFPSGASFLAKIRNAVKLLSAFSVKADRSDNPEKIKGQFLVRQLRAIEDMLVERGAHDTGITVIE